MVLEKEEEEEKARLLGDSPTSSPNKQSDEPDKFTGLRIQRRGSQNQVRPSLDFDSELVPRFGWQGNSSQPQQLLFGQAEKTFFSMSGALATSSSRVSKERTPGDDNKCDMIAQVPDSIEVVRNILSELEADNDTYSDNEVDHDSSNAELTFMTCLESGGQQTEEKVDEGSECTCNSQFLNLTNYPGTRGSLVVDVHHEGCVVEVENRCGKHTTERFPRCYSESHRQRDRLREDNQLVNLDKIEMVGEDRLRHFSESAVGANKRKRAATFSSEIKQLRKSLLLGKSQNLQEKEGDVELPAKCGSTDSFLSDVKFDIWDEQASEQSSQFGEVENTQGMDECDFGSNFEFTPHPLVASLRNGVAIPASMSHSSSTTSMPICRICQLPSMEPNNPLLSPCRCLGSIRYVHSPCLKKWLEVSSKKNSDPPGCELCQYQYIRHKKFMISNWLVPSCSSKDKILHSIFMAAIAIMITCSIVTIICFKQNGDIQPRVGPDTELSASELMTLSCGVLFFLAFFVAMYVEVKAENTIYQLICKFFYMNHEWTIEEYDRRKDPAKQIDSP